MQLWIKFYKFVTIAIHIFLAECILVKTYAVYQNAINVQIHFLVYFTFLYYLHMGSQKSCPRLYPDGINLELITYPRSAKLYDWINISSTWIKIKTIFLGRTVQLYLNTSFAVKFSIEFGLMYGLVHSFGHFIVYCKCTVPGLRKMDAEGN